MLIGISLMPEYFEERLNLFIAMAPAARLSNCKSEYFIKAADLLL
jgi:hypothetical protein